MMEPSLSDWLNARLAAPPRIAGVVVMPTVPQAWAEADILTASTPLRVIRCWEDFASVQRVDGHDFPFADGGRVHMLLPRQLLVEIDADTQEPVLS